MKLLPGQYTAKDFLKIPNIKRYLEFRSTRLKVNWVFSEEIAGPDMYPIACNVLSARLLKIPTGKFKLFLFTQDPVDPSQYEVIDEFYSLKDYAVLDARIATLNSETDLEAIVILTEFGTEKCSKFLPAVFANREDCFQTCLNLDITVKMTMLAGLMSNQRITLDDLKDPDWFKNTEASTISI